MPPMREPVLTKAIEKAGGVNALARGLGISSASVAAWRRVPVTRVRDVADITGIPAAELRPDLAAAFGQAA